MARNLELVDSKITTNTNVLQSQKNTKKDLSTSKHDEPKNVKCRINDQVHRHIGANVAGQSFDKTNNKDTQLLHLPIDVAPNSTQSTASSPQEHGQIRQLRDNSDDTNTHQNKTSHNTQSHERKTELTSDVDHDSKVFDAASTTSASGLIISNGAAFGAVTATPKIHWAGGYQQSIASESISTQCTSTTNHYDYKDGRIIAKRWYLGYTIGKGSFGWVKAGYQIENKEQVALKFVPRKQHFDYKSNFYHNSYSDNHDYTKIEKRIEQETKVLSQINHPNIASLLAYDVNCKYPARINSSRLQQNKYENKKQFEFLDTTLFVFEWAEKGQLFDLLYYTHSLEETVCSTYLRQLVSGLECLHSYGIIFNDIKPSNLLLDKDFNLKITDLGLCKIFNPVNDMMSDYDSSKIEFKTDTTDLSLSDSNEDDHDTKLAELETKKEYEKSRKAGAHCFAAPEILFGEKYDCPCDVFSAGVVLFCLLNGYHPFESANTDDEIYTHVADNEFDEFWITHENCRIFYNEKARNLIEKMIEYNPDSRITIEQLKDNYWYKNTPYLTKNALTEALNFRYQQMILKKDPDADNQSSTFQSHLTHNTANTNATAASISTKFMQLDDSEVASQWLSEKTFAITNPLVVMLGISEYHGMPNLDGVLKDYQNIIVIFSRLFGYDILYKLANDKYNTNKCEGNVNDSFKMKWTDNDIDEFVEEAKSLLENNNNKYDSLIFILSCHGEAEGVILDSNCEEYSLFSIFAKFNGSSLPHFAYCPKIFFVDACRGTMRSKPINVAVTLHHKLQEFIVAPKGKYCNDNTKVKFSNKKINNNYNNSIDQPTETEINIHQEANFFFVYANPDGYAAFDGGTKGGYLIRAIYKVFKKKEIISKNLDGIILHVAEKVKQLVGKQSMQHVQTVSNIHYRIKFRLRDSV